MKQPLAIADIQQGFDYYTIQLFTKIPHLEAELDFQRISDGDNGAIWCELSVYVITKGDKTRIVPPSRTNLMNSSRAGWRGHLETLEAAASELQWEDMMTQAVGIAIDAYRNGAQATELVLEKTSKHRPPWLLEPFIASSGVSVLFGEGGVGKSLLGLGAALSVATETEILGTWAHKKGPVIYFDYEDDDSIHRLRLNALARGHDITELEHPIFHYSLVAKVSQAQSQMRRIIRDHGAVCCVLDSIGMGRGGDAGTAEDTIRLFRALRSLDIPVLALDHVTKEDKRKGGTVTPYGSIYTVNSARLLWGAKMSSASTSNRRFVNLENTKANHVARQQNCGLEISYGSMDNGTLHTATIKQHDEWWDEVDDELADMIEGTTNEQ